MRVTCPEGMLCPGGYDLTLPLGGFLGFCLPRRGPQRVSWRDVRAGESALNRQGLCFFSCNNNSGCEPADGRYGCANTPVMPSSRVLLVFGLHLACVRDGRGDNTLAVAICRDQLVTAVQSMSALSNLDTSWVEPTRAVFNMVAVSLSSKIC